MGPLTLTEAKELFEAEVRGIANLFSESRESGGVAGEWPKVVICPPFPYLGLLHDIIDKKYQLIDNTIALGAQNVFYKVQGAYTGEVSPQMLKNLGVEYVLIGHSERRRLLGESDELVNKKLKASLQAGLKPVFLLGDEKSLDYHGTLESQRAEERQELNRIKKQLQLGLDEINREDIPKIIFGYEPVWAISSVSGGRSAAPEYVNDLIKKIRQECLATLYDIKTANKTVFVYGGSSNSKNITGFLEKHQISGVLPGGASLQAQEFIKMVEIAMIGN